MAFIDLLFYVSFHLKREYQHGILKICVYIVKFAVFLGTVLKMYKIEGVVELYNTTFKNWYDGMVKKTLHNVIYLLIDSSSNIYDL